MDFEFLDVALMSNELIENETRCLRHFLSNIARYLDMAYVKMDSFFLLKEEEARSRKKEEDCFALGFRLRLGISFTLVSSDV